MVEVEDAIEAVRDFEAGCRPKPTVKPSLMSPQPSYASPSSSAPTSLRAPRPSYASTSSSTWKPSPSLKRASRHSQASSDRTSTPSAKTRSSSAPVGRRASTTIAVVADAKAWKPTADEDRERTSWPLRDVDEADYAHFDPAGSFKSFLANVKKHDGITVDQYTTAMARFLSLLDPDGFNERKIDKILLECWSSNVFQELEPLPLWSPVYGFTRHMVVTLSHLAAFSKIEAVRNDDLLRAAKIDSLITTVIQPKMKQCSAARKEQREKKKSRDADRLKVMMQPSERVVMMRKCMLDAMTMQKHFEQDDIVMTHTDYHIMNVGLQTVLYGNQPPGRSKEWQNQNADATRSYLDDPAKVSLKMASDKVMKIYGEMVKWLADGTRQHMKLYDKVLAQSEKLEGVTAMTFLRRKGGKKVNVHISLRAAQRVYKTGPYAVNLLRKSFATATKRKDIAARIVASVQRHRPETMEDNYVAHTDEDKALDSKFAWIGFFGEPASFPTEDEWQQDGRSYEELVAAFNGAHQQDEEDDGKDCNEHGEEEDRDDEDDGDDVDGDEKDGDSDKVDEAGDGDGDGGDDRRDAYAEAYTCVASELC